MNRSIFKYCVLLLLAVWIQPSAAKNIITDSFLIAHLKTQQYKIDPEASAVILYERESYAISIDNGLFTRKTYVRRVIRILKEDALKLANISLFSFTDSDPSVAATTYNLSGDSLNRYPIRKEDILKKNVGGGIATLSFFLGSVKPGSIIDYSYEQTTHYTTQLYTWQIEGNYPKLTTEYSLSYPFLLAFYPVRYPALTPVRYRTEDSARIAADTFSHTMYNDGKGNLINSWIRRNVAAFKEEEYIVNQDNYRETLELYLPGILGQGMPTWKGLNSEIWKAEDGLSKPVLAANKFFRRTLDTLVTPAMSEKEKAIKIFRFVRDHITVISSPRDKTKVLDLKEIWETEEGTNVGINTLLMAMLVKAGLKASPVITSTTSVRSIDTAAPLPERMRYIACAVNIGGEYLLLDASDKNNMAGMLPSECYNGYAWVAGDKGDLIDLSPGLLHNKEVFKTKVDHFENGVARVDIQIKSGNISSMELRRGIAKNKEAGKKYLERLKKHLPEGIEITNESIDFIDAPDTNVLIHMSGRWTFDSTADIYYLGLNMAGSFNKNPFADPARKLPVEFPYLSDYADYMTIELPADIVPDNLPEPTNLVYDSSEIRYKKILTYVPELRTVTVSAVFTMARTKFDPSEYPVVREFFGNIVADNANLLVLKRRKQ